MTKFNLKTPVSYYGGKQQLCRLIVSLLPDHNLYSEPFLGGAAVFFAKEKSNVEVLNDTNRELINFYRVVQNDFVSLEKEVRITLHSRDQFRQASVIYNNPDMFSELKRAWALWVLASQSFSSILDGSWGYERISDKTPKRLDNKKQNFTEELAIRLQSVQLECTDALRVIMSRDTPDSLFYCDPPYFNSDCGHYDGYSLKDFEELLTLLSRIQGKFILSSYPSETLKAFTKANGWFTRSINQTVSVNAKSGTRKPKVEMLTANFEI